MASNDSSKSGPTTTTLSRLLLWPRRRRRPKHDVGFVLGWKTKRNIPVTHHVGSSRPSTAQRETVVCAGVLPPTQSLATYRRRLAKFQHQIDKYNPKLCCCLYQSLEIVALWTASPNTKLSDEIKSAGLQVITQQQRGYPWWKATGDQETTHQQLVLYDPPGGDQINAYSHFHSEYGHQSSENDWLQTLHQLNHASDVLRSLKTEVFLIPTPLPSFAEDAETATALPEPLPKRPPIGLLSKLQTLVLRNSMTLLHFRQIYQTKPATPTLYALSFLSIIRCFQTKPVYPTHANTSFPCRLCGQTPLCVDRSKVVQTYVAHWNLYLDAVLDFSLGIMVSLLLAMTWYYAHRQYQYHLWSYYIDSRQWSIRTLTDSVTFLEHFPAGFKLNVPLTQNMGQAIRSLVSFQQQCLEATLWNRIYGATIFLPILLSLAATCGWTTFLAILMDLWRIEGLHLWLLTMAFRQMYKVELFLLSALFRLFRGRKRNLLRRRTDSMQYDAMQLLVGTIGFCICIFLWTTIMVYYTFFVIFNWLWNFPIMLLWMGYIFCGGIPWGTLGWRLRRPKWFALTVHLEFLNEKDDVDNENDTTNGGSISVAKLCSVAQPPVRLVVTDVAVHVRPILSWLMNSLLEVLVPRRTNQAPCSIPLATFMEQFHKEELEMKT